MLQTRKFKVEGQKANESMDAFKKRQNKHHEAFCEEFKKRYTIERAGKKTKEVMKKYNLKYPEEEVYVDNEVKKIKLSLRIQAKSILVIPLRLCALRQMVTTG